MKWGLQENTVKKRHNAKLDNLMHTVEGGQLPHTVPDPPHSH